MKGKTPRGKGSFHELPLILFAAFVMAGGGLGCAHILLSLVGWLPWIPSYGVVTLITLFFAVGLFLSWGHLGRPLRGPFALRRVGKSPLSNEALAAGLTSVVGVVAVLLPAGHGLAPPVFLALPPLSALTVLALGAVYRLKGQLTWGGETAFQPLFTGLGFGLALLLETLPTGAVARAEILILVVLLADGALVVRRAGTVNRALVGDAPVHPEIVEARGAAFILRLLIGILLPAWFLLEGQVGLAVSLLFLVLFLDRFLFYGLAVRSTTEGAARRVEAFLTELNQ